MMSRSISQPTAAISQITTEITTYGYDKAQRTAHPAHLLPAKGPGHPEGYPGPVVRNTAGGLRGFWEHCNHIRMGTQPLERAEPRFLVANWYASS